MNDPREISGGRPNNHYGVGVSLTPILPPVEDIPRTGSYINEWQCRHRRDGRRRVDVDPYLRPWVAAPGPVRRYWFGDAA